MPWLDSALLSCPAGASRRNLSRQLRSGLLWLTALGLLVLPAHAEPLGQDPVPLRRVWIAPQQVEKELQRLKEGVLQELPRRELEDRLQQLADRLQKEASPPRLLKARYWAKLHGQVLSGSGDWTLFHPAAAPGILSLEELRLPLQGVKINSQPAVLGALDGKTAGLLIPTGGRHTILFDWSLSGSAMSHGLRCDFSAPSCASSSLELTLPADYAVTIPSGNAVLSGPEFAGQDGWQLWRLHFAGPAQVSFVLQRIRGADVSPALPLTRLTTTQTLFPDRVLSEFKCQVEILHGVVDRLEFEWDRTQHPLEVLCPGMPLKTWAVEQRPIPAAQGQPAKHAGTVPVLVVYFSEPVPSQLLPVQIPVTIRCQALLPEQGPWTSPGLHLQGAVSRGETLLLRLHPDVQLQDWRTGTFRLLKTERQRSPRLTELAAAAALSAGKLPAPVAPPVAGGALAAGTGGSDEFHVLTLVEEGTGKSSRPGGRLSFPKEELSVQQRTWWKIGAARNTLTAELRYRVLRGTLRQLTVELPGPNKNAWQVDAVKVAPAEWLHNWFPLTEKQQRLVLVELERGVTAGEEVLLTIHLRSPLAEKKALQPHTLTFPHLKPRGSLALAGALAISVDPLYRLASVQTDLAATPAEANGPWGRTLPDLFYSYRNRSMAGELHVQPNAAELHARSQLEATLAEHKARLGLHLEVTPLRGAANHLDFFCTVPVEVPWTWKPAPGSADVLAVQPIAERVLAAQLLRLGFSHPLAALVGTAAWPAGQWWRVTLARPLNQSITLHLESSVRPRPAADEASSQQSWDIPLVQVANAHQTTGEVILQTLQTQIQQVQGLTPEKSPDPEPGRTVCRYHVAQTETLRTRLHVQTQTLLSPAAPQQFCEQVRLTTYVQPGGKLLHHFRGTIQGWQRGKFPIVLPEGTQLLLARVQGRWLETAPQTRPGQRTRLELPVGAAEMRTPFEVVYTSRWQELPLSLWSRAAAPAPELPLAPLSFQRTWKLPPHLLPLAPERYQSLPHLLGPTLDTSASLAGQLWRGFDALFTLDSRPAASPAEQQRKLLLRAEADFRKSHAGQEGPLQMLLDRLLQDQPALAGGLVIDAVALAEARLAPQTICTVPASAKNQQMPPFWEHLGLSVLSCDQGLLLTTRQQLQAWLEQEALIGTAPGTLSAAVGQAIQHDHDLSGRYWNFLAWSSRLADDPEADLAGQTPLTETLGQGRGWTAWQPLVSDAAAETLHVVDGTRLTFLGVALAGLTGLCLGALGGCLALRWRFRLALAGLAGAMLILIWTPPLLWGLVWPSLLIAVLTTLGLFYMAPRTAERSAPSQKSVRLPVASAGLLLVGLLGALAGSTQAQEAAPFPVYLLGNPQAPLEQQKALVPPALLEQLTALERRTRQTTQDAVIVSASYQGTLQENDVQWRAELQVYCFTNAAQVLLPFAGLQLQEGALLEGAPVYPIPADKPHTGYVVRIDGRRGKFVHLSLPLRSSSQLAGEVREVSLALPRTLQNRLQVQLPAQTPWAQLTPCTGQQKWQREGGFLKGEAYLGWADRAVPDKQLKLYWYPAAPASRPEVEVTEYHLWEVRSTTADLSSPDLTTVFKYQVRKGAVSELLVQLPDEVHVRSLEVEATGEEAARGPAVRRKSWHVDTSHGQRLLHVLLDAPVSGELQLTLGLLTELPVQGDHVTLTLPGPLAARSQGGYLAYRTEGTEPHDQLHMRSTNLQPKVFAQQWQKLRMREPSDLKRAYFFQRAEKGGSASIRLVFTPRTPQLEQNLHWQLHPQYAEVQATLTSTAAGQPVTALNWLVPRELTLAEVTGADLLRWVVAQQGEQTRLQIWFTEPRQQAAVQLRGWLKPGQKYHGQLLWQPPRADKPGHFVLPPLLPATEGTCSTQVSVTAAPGLGLRPEHLQQLNPVAGEKTLIYTTRQLDYGAAFQVRPLPVLPEASLLMEAERHKDGVHILAHLHYEIPVDMLRAATFEIHNWKGKPWKLEAPGTLAVQKQALADSAERWTVTLAPGITRTFTLKLTGVLPLAENAAFTLPEIAVKNAHRQNGWLAFRTTQFHLEERQGLSRASAPEPRPAFWPQPTDSAEPPPALLKVTARDWRLRLRPRELPPPAALHVLHAEQRLRMADQQKWLHESRYVLSTHGSQVAAALPPGAQLLSAALDGQIIYPHTQINQSLQFTVPDTGPHTVILRWFFPPGEEQIGSPRLLQPRLANTPEAAALWTVLLPAGYELDSETARPMPAARADLERAAAQLELLDHGFSTSNTKTLAAETVQQVEQAFYWYCRQAESKWTQGNLPTAEQMALRQQWHELQARNEELARKHKFMKLRLQAQKLLQPPPPLSCTAALPETGLPLHWYTRAGETPPTLRLISAARLQQRDDLYRSEVVLMVLAVLWIVSLLPGMVAFLRRTWPEQLLLLAFLLNQLLGWSVLGMLLIALAISVRLWLLGLAVQRWLSRRRGTAPSSAGSSVASARSSGIA